MSKVLIVYGSTTGNTEYVAERIEEKMKAKDHDVTTLDVSQAEVEGLANAYDVVLFGCSTWGEDEIELQDDFIPLYDDLASCALDGKKVAVFGCGDSSYEYYCGAVDVIEERSKENGAEIIYESLKIDGDPRSELGDIEDWANGVAGAA